MDPYQSLVENNVPHKRVQLTFGNKIQRAIKVKRPDFKKVVHLLTVDTSRPSPIVANCRRPSALRTLPPPLSAVPNGGPLNTRPLYNRRSAVRFNPLSHRVPNTTDVVRVPTFEPLLPLPAVPNRPNAIRTSTVGSLDTQPPSRWPSTVHMNTTSAVPNMTNFVGTPIVESVNIQHLSQSSQLPYLQEKESVDTGLLELEKHLMSDTDHEEWPMLLPQLFNDDQFVQQNNIPSPTLSRILPSESLDWPNFLNNQGSNDILPPPVPTNAPFLNDQRSEGIPPPAVPATQLRNIDRAGIYNNVNISSAIPETSPLAFSGILPSGSVDWPNFMNNQGSDDILPPPVPTNAPFLNDQRSEGIPPPPVPATQLSNIDWANINNNLNISSAETSPLTFSGIIPPGSLDWPNSLNDQGSNDILPPPVLTNAPFLNDQRLEGIPPPPVPATSLSNIDRANIYNNLNISSAIQTSPLTFSGISPSGSLDWPSSLNDQGFSDVLPPPVPTYGPFLNDQRSEGIPSPPVPASSLSNIDWANHDNNVNMSSAIPETSPLTFSGILPLGSLDWPNSLNDQGFNEILPPPVPANADRDNFLNDQRSEGIPPPPVPASSLSNIGGANYHNNLNISQAILATSPFSDELRFLSNLRSQRKRFKNGPTTTNLNSLHCPGDKPMVGYLN